MTSVFPASSTSDPWRDVSVLLHDALDSADGAGSLLFSDPRGLVTCRAPGEIAAAFAEAEAALSEGLYLAGGFAYELGYHLEPRLVPLAPPGVLLFQLGVFARCERLDAAGAAAHVRSRASHVAGGPAVLRPALDAATYGRRLAVVHDRILSGDIYQANFTFPVSAPWSGDAWSLYARLMAHQRVAYGGVFDLPDLQAVSLSPELFFRRRGDLIESRPMKGTMARGATPGEDAAAVRRLRGDAKNRAENLMILDLIRNDIGRMARLGTVAVPRAFEIETYETLHQMVSTVTGVVPRDLPLHEIMRHLFPCGSVTGAPKIRAMEIIAELEDGPRGLYTGALGYVTPERDMCFSVPIRTVVLRDGQATMGVGSGVVADSVAADEYEECLLKARFLALGLA